MSPLTKQTFFSSLAIGAALLTAHATTDASAMMPPMPGMTQGPGGDAGMIHTEVLLLNNDITVTLRGGPAPGGGTFDGNTNAPVTMSTGGPFMAPFNVLNNKGFNAQYGWLPDQDASNQLQDTNVLPLDRLIAVELISLGAQNPGTLYTYSGGNGMQMMNGMHSMNPLFAQVGDQFLWDDFIMHHNWYAADTPGLYEATYDVYVADLNGNRDTAYTGDTTTLRFNLVPEPASAVLLLAPALMLIRQRMEN